MKPWEKYSAQQPQGKKPWEKYAAQTPESQIPEKTAAQLGAEQAWEESPAWVKFGVGVAKPFVETWKGVKDLVGVDLSDEEMAALERLQEVKGGWGTAGQITGELATLAVPAGAAAKGVRAASQGPRLVRALAAARGAPLAAEMATVGGMESLKAPTDDRSRGEAFVEGAVGTAVGAGAGQVLKRALGGLTFREGAKELLDAGVPLTPGQAANSGLQTMENALANVPVVGTPIRNMQRKAVEGWNREVLKKVMPDDLVEKVTKGGNEGFEQATNAFSEAYESLFRGMVKPNPRGVQAMNQITAGQPKGIFANIQSTLAKGGNVPAKTIEEWDDLLRKEAMAAVRRGDQGMQMRANAGRKALRTIVPENMASRWDELDGAFREFATARKAATYQNAARNRGTFTPAELLRASAAQDKSSGKRAFAQGQAALQQEALDVGDILQLPSRGLAEQLSFPVGAGVALIDPATAATGYIGSRAAFNEGTRKAMIALQKLLTQGKEPTKEIVEKLEREYGLTPGTLGAALTVSGSDD